MARERSNAARFAAFDGVLTHFESLWRPRPFTERRLPFEDDAPELAAALRALDDGAVAALESDAHALANYLARFVPELAAIPALVDVPVRAEPAAVPLPIGFEWGVDGRKWRQVRAFVACIEDHDAHAPHPIASSLDWCAGKAHLGRYYGWRTGTPVHAVERDARLCADAERLAAARGIALHATACDVLRDDVAFPEHGFAFALHACGRLHLRLLRGASEAHCPRIALAPCCYHLTDADDTVLSAQARASSLALRPDELHLAVQETVTSGRSRSRQRERESAWRLGFDAWQREVRGVDDYLPVPSMPRAQLREDFASFVAWAAARKGLPVPPATRLRELEKIGEARHREVTRLALPRHLFRRVLELWLVLDRALFLEANGYAVNVQAFCPREVTPRNLLLDAQRVGWVTGA